MLQHEGIVDQMERMLLKTPECASVHIGETTEGGLEVHLLLRPGRDGEQLIHDFKSTMLSRYGWPPDALHFRVTQLRDEGAEVTNRARLVAAGYQVQDAIATAQVALSMGTLELRAIVSGPATRQNRHRLVARAALEAVRNYFRSLDQVDVEDVVIVKVGDSQVALIAVAFVTPDGEEVLFTGSSVFDLDEREGVAKATLDALNRQFILGTGSS